MATISKNTIIGNGFTVGLNVPSALGLDDGADGSYIIAANQIAWGNNSIFNGKKFGNTTAQLLAAIEDAISDISDVASKVQTSSPTGTSTSGPTLTFTNFDATLQWGKSVTIAGITDDDYNTVKLPANPNTDTKVISVDNHYKTTGFNALTTEGLYKIKTDAAGHIIKATQVNLSDYASKAEYNVLLQEFNELKSFIGWNVTDSSTKP